MSKGQQRSDLLLFWRLLRFARPVWPHIAGLFLLGLLASPIALLNPVPLKIAVDSVLGSSPLPGFLQAMLPARLTGSSDGILFFAVGLLVAVALLGQVQNLAYSLLKTYVTERLSLDFRRQLFGRAQRLSLSYHDSTGTADTIYRIERDSASLNQLTVEGVIPFVSSLVTVLAMIYVSIRIDWQLALVALAVAPALFAVTSTMKRRMRVQSRHVARLSSRVLGVVQETLSSLRVVKAFGQEERQTERFVERGSETLQARLRLAITEHGAGLLVGLITAFGMALVLYIGVRHVTTGVITLGQLLLITGYLGQFYRPLNSISRKVTSVQTKLTSAERALSLLDEPTDVPERADALALERATGAVEFRDVSFRYEPEHPVLEDVSFAFPAGTRVAITGPTGAGKTTLVSLLTRFYDPTAGAILLDGVDLRAYRLADLRAQFAFVLQQPVLFSTTIAENIAYGRPAASKDEIVAAAKAANAHDFIVALPDGYESQVGERGMKVSGGERQRIGLARAFLKDAPILILDEPTSSVDVKTEATILEALGRLMEDRTVFMITHRLNSATEWPVQLEIRNRRVRVGSLKPAGSRMPTTDAPSHPRVPTRETQ
jgi:ATP-binding cassette subfamily B protein